MIRTVPSGGGHRPHRIEAVAPRQQAAYRCQRGHDFTVMLAADVSAPGDWDCRCGAGARLSGSVPAGIDDGSGQEWRMAKLHERRTVAELEQILAERLAEMKAGPPREQPQGMSSPVHSRRSRQKNAHKPLTM